LLIRRNYSYGCVGMTDCRKPPKGPNWRRDWKDFGVLSTSAAERTANAKVKRIVKKRLGLTKPLISFLQLTDLKKEINYLHKEKRREYAKEAYRRAKEWKKRITGL
jgi:hypothetical protein